MQYTVRICWNLWFSYLSKLGTSGVTEIQANFDINKRDFFQINVLSYHKTNSKLLLDNLIDYV